MKAMLAAAAALLAFNSAAIGQAAFFAAMPDVPLPAGAMEAPGPLTFDTDAARFTLSFASAPTPLEETAAFYAAAMPELGWSLTQASQGEQIYVRGRDRLSLRFTPSEEGRLTIVAELTSHPASQALD